MSAEHEPFVPPESHANVSLRLLPHALRPLPPLAQEMFSAFMAAFGGGRPVAINGYPYLGGGGGAPTAQLDPSPYQSATETWSEHCLPAARAICEDLRAGDYESLSAGELAAALPDLVQASAKAFAYTMVPLFGMVGPVGELIAFCQEKLGDEGALEAMTMLQGFDNDSAETGLALDRLVGLAGASPALAAAVRAGDLGAAGQAEGGEPFRAAFEAYVDEFGHGSQTWFELHAPTWAEEPAIPLRLLGSYLDGTRSPGTAHERAAEQREEAIARIEARLDGDERAQLRRLLAQAHDYVAVIEGRARWQQNAVGACRVPCLAMGEKLAAGGVLAARDDVFSLTLAEIAQAASPAGLANVRELVSRRQGDIERWERLDPPVHLGPPPEAGGPPVMQMMFGAPVAQASGDPALIEGVGASRGTATGRARVILSLADAGRLEPGDVLVCPFTAPAWTPLFATASAIVTNQGGVLSHAAIEAREFGLPCVVGTIEGTQRIPDGAQVTVDGLGGTVRVAAE